MAKKLRLLATAVSCAVSCVMTISSAEFRYTFNSVPLSDAIAAIAEEHADIRISFIYNELDRYRAKATVNTDDAYLALRQIIGQNPVSIVCKGDAYYIEALQHGKYEYRGSVLSADESEPLPGASVMVLSLRDSTVITYGVSDADGHFLVPCDKKNVLMKISCVGYKTAYINRPTFSVGSVMLQPQPVRLGAVSVAAENTVFAMDKNTYIPSMRQKNASQDATDLLRRMAIPQLVVNPGDNSIKDVFGNGVPVYINYQEAAPDELKGMNMRDVRRVEYIEFPTDSRFKGELRVINIIVQEYEYGGYTKVFESFTGLNGLLNNSSVISRFTYKKVTYNVSAGSMNGDFSHTGAENTALYHLKDGTVNREETLNESHERLNEYPMTLRVSYNGEKLSTRNSLTFTHSSTPEQYVSGRLSVGSGPEEDYRRSTPKRHNTVGYLGEVQGRIGQTVSFDITPSFNHTHRNNVSYYKSSLMSSPLHNIITEDAYYWNLRASGMMVMRQKHRLSVFFGIGQNHNRLVYTGTDNMTDSYSITFASGNIRYRFQTKKCSFSVFSGVGSERNRMNGITTDDVYPVAGVNASVALTQKSQISAYLYYQTSTPGISMRANDLVRSNEFMYLTANPYLKSWRQLQSNAAYNWYRNNTLSLGVFGGYDRDFNRVATVYRPFDGGQAILRDFINDGDYIHAYIGVSINYKMFDNNLQLYANMTQNSYRTTGLYKDSLMPFRVQLQAVYYWKAFNILASWGNPQRNLTGNSNIIIRGRSFHMLSAGWGNGKWTINLSAKNIFNKGWRSETWYRQSPLFCETVRNFSPSVHPSLNLSVTYTVSYGKKVRQSNETTTQISAPSAIMQ
ncbi:MAG: carboxypeptidase-like regulatory domain-containing protein [Muribaculaceae bacterium]|nr:carboxypeptidase-like regulatory domain-containing protein [Muribaculaceae bacterium]